MAATPSLSHGSPTPFQVTWQKSLPIDNMPPPSLLFPTQPREQVAAMPTLNRSPGASGTSPPTMGYILSVLWYLTFTQLPF